jgi:DNA-directed RNA polymerase beta' subunit/DNA-directed RNA polymerase subunit H (RpoH/RPB5)
MPSKTVKRPEYANPSKIIGIQFSMLSPEEIRKNSVAEINKRDTYINNKPVLGGLFDPRMGVLEPGLICPTDGLTNMETPGYFGHIELARPVFFIQHIKEIMKICGCVCFKCSKLLINKAHHTHILERDGEDRWQYVSQLCSKVKRCGEATEDGCGCKQPDKIKLEGMATIQAIWEKIDSSDLSRTATMKLTPEIVLKIFKRISDEDVSFMGFNPIWSRPDWMICQVLPVPPPAVRPSVKQDAQQRSEDDLTHIYSNIIKYNNDLADKINNNANPSVIEGLTLHLQYFIAMIVNNKVKGAVPMAQRSGRPLQCIMGRINSKNGRIRGNLMGKRVDYSARSVITGDPNLSIRQLGVPMKIAKNLTKPIVVNDRNREFLMKLIQNGPDVHPGAKIVERKNGEQIYLRYVDRASIRLMNGDVVHRHMMDGDAVLFNRQPSLHKMSMMCHIAKIMTVGDTFRMNVGDTKPYNADFDGDEMNMHLPQNVIAETELRHLAAIPYQIVSPASNSPIIGIYQDSLLGAYRFTREEMKVSPRDAMNVLMRYPNVDVSKILEKGKQLTNFDILSQITPPITLKYKTKLFADGEDYATSNNVLEIRNGNYVRGQMDKSVLGSTSKGIIHRAFNDYGNMAASDYIDHLQNVVTEYMKTSSFSVGISDLISNAKTANDIGQSIVNYKSQVTELIEQLHLGIFKNNTSSSNMDEFENMIGNILNKASDEMGKIGRKSLSKNNRFLTIVNSGSKGNMSNICNMVSCLGQVNVDGKRIPYGFDGRTLPHFSKYDDTPSARGFIENSYISGLSAPELFFHAMHGRIGLIDTAVKSVTWETPIVVIVDRKPIYTEIGRWIDGQLDDDSNKPLVQHFTERNMELLNLTNGNVYIPTTCENGHVTWEEITAITRHDPGDVLYEIRSLGGRSVIVTESKSLLIWDDAKQGFFEKPSPEIKVGDCVPVTSALVTPPVVLESFHSNGTEINLNETTGFEFGNKYATDDTVEHLPTEFLLANNSFIKGFLQSYLSLNCQIENNSLNVFGKTYRLLEGISMLLSRVGIFACLVKGDGSKLTIQSQWIPTVLSEIPLLNRSLNEQLRELVPANHFKTHNDVVLDPIVEITLVSVEKHPKVYDLTIPTTLNFGLANGLQVRDTSQTGYIQRRLIKGLEDLQVEYDLTVRNSKGKIIQFVYGDDGFDTGKVEIQRVPMASMSIEDIYMHYDMPGVNENDRNLLMIYTKSALARVKKQRDKTRVACKTRINQMLEWRDDIVERIFKSKNDDAVSIPVAFEHIINNVQGNLGVNANSLVDITPLEVFELADEYYEKLKNLYYAPPTELFHAMYSFYTSPNHLLAVKRFHRKGIVLLLETIVLKYKQAIVHPGEMVGVIAGQSIGEPTTQLTLNTFHLTAGAASKTNVTRGVPRIEEILRLTKNPKNPSLTIHLKQPDETDHNRAMKIANMIEHTKLHDVVKSIQICFDPNDDATNMEEDRLLMEQFYEFERMVAECGGATDSSNTPKSNWILRMEMDPEILLDKNITMDDIHFAIKTSEYGSNVQCVFSDYNCDKLVFRIRVNSGFFTTMLGKRRTGIPNPLDKTDEIYLLKSFQDTLLNKIVLRGISAISNNRILTIYKARNTILELMESLHYNVSDYKGFSINEIDAMYTNSQLDMLLSGDGKTNHSKTYIRWCLSTKIRPNTLDEMIEDLYYIDNVLEKSDTLVIIADDEPNDTILAKLRYLYDHDGIFVVVHNIRRLQFNLLEHALVPAVRVLSDKEWIELKDKYNIKHLAQLPEICRFDPMALAICMRPGQVCEIQRDSPTALSNLYYRACI